MVLPRTFADKLRAEMDDRGMGARTLARHLDPDHVEHARRTVRRWLAGMQPTQANRDRVTDALGLERGALDPDEDEEAALADVLHGLVAEVSALRRDLRARDDVRSVA